MLDITQTSENTPFSNEPIPKVSANDWSKMSRTQLEDQKYKLQQRLQLAYQTNNPTIIQSIIAGIEQISQIIANYKGK